MRCFFPAFFVLLGSLCPALAQRVINQSAAVAAGQGVALDLKMASTIRVRPGTGPNVNVTARVSINNNQLNEALSLVMEPSGSELSIIESLDKKALHDANYQGQCSAGAYSNSAVWEGNGHDSYHYCLHTDYEVTLPAGTPLRISTISGSVDVSGLGGEITIKTVSGSLALDGLTGPLTVRSVSGNIKLTHPGVQPVQAASVSGNVDLSWPLTQPADLTLKTVSGEVYADPSVTFTNRRATSGVGYPLRGSVGTGLGPLVKLESVSGNVFFRPQK